MSMPVQLVITTPEFRRGQAACQETAARFGIESAAPAPWLQDRAQTLVHPEFRLGYLHEWGHLTRQT